MIRSALLALLFSLTAVAAQAATEKIVVAGGCFWCVEADFESVQGVIEAVSGFSGGDSGNPSYEGHEGHLEAVEITFDPAVISRDEILRLFLRSVDVTDAEGQFCDRGDAYTTAIFVSDKAERAIAQAAIAQAEADLGQSIVTPVRAAKTFWPAEAYHQDYYKGTDLILTRAGLKKRSNAYKFYREACGRDARVRALWGDAAAFAR